MAYHATMGPPGKITFPRNVLSALTNPEVDPNSPYPAEPDFRAHAGVVEEQDGTLATEQYYNINR